MINRTIVKITDDKGNEHKEIVKNLHEKWRNRIIDLSYDYWTRPIKYPVAFIEKYKDHFILNWWVRFKNSYKTPEWVRKGAFVQIEVIRERVIPPNMIDRDKVVELLNTGMNDYDIAKMLNCHPQTIIHIRTQELGALKRIRTIRNPTIKSQIVDLWNSGERSRVEIAKKAGTDSMYVSTVLLQKGLREQRPDPLNTYIKFYEEIVKGPKFIDELEKMFGMENACSFYHIARVKGLTVRKFKLEAPAKSATIRIHGQGGRCIYFLDSQKELALERIKERFPEVFDKNTQIISSVLNAFGIKMPFVGNSNRRVPKKFFGKEQDYIDILTEKSRLKHEIVEKREELRKKSKIVELQKEIDALNKSLKRLGISEEEWNKKPRSDKK